MGPFRSLLSRKLRNATIGGQELQRKEALSIKQSHEKHEGNYGLFEFKNDNNATAEQLFPVDIIAIHGLGGDRFHTWTDPETGVLWLRDLLPKDMPGARIYSFGYNSEVFGDSVTMITDYARQLLIDLELEELSSRPKIFVCHSLGGIVAKKAILEAHIDPRHSVILRAVRAIMFLGTPHRGSDIATAFSNLAQIVNIGMRSSLVSLFVGEVRTELISLLKPNSNVLQEISDGFRHRSEELSITSCYETQITKGLGKLVVPKNSATIGYPRETLIPVDGDHSSICRFRSQEDTKYKRVKGELIKVAHSLVSSPNQIASQIQSSRSVQCKLMVDICRLGKLIAQSIALSESEQEYIQVFGQETDADHQSRYLRSEGTCVWLLQTEQYVQWKSAMEASILWLTGDPGTGKTTLSRFVLDSLNGKLLDNSARSQKEPPKSNNTRTCYFFCQAGGIERPGVTSILRGMLARLLLDDQLLLNHMRNRFIRKRFEIAQSFESLWTAFEYAIRHIKTQTLYLVLDGLDECDEVSRQKLLQSIAALSNSLQANPGACYPIIKVLATSLPLIFVSTFEKSSLVTNYRLRIEDRPIAFIKDIARMISARTEDFIVKQLCNEADARYLKDELVKRSETSFLWVRFVLQDIEESFTLRRATLELALRSLPRDLKMLYEHYLPHIPRSETRILRRLLHLLCATERPLRLSELSILLAVEENTTAEGVYKERHSSMPLMLERMLGPTVRISDSTLSFTHPSVRRFFIDLAQDISHPLYETHAVHLEAAHTTMAAACLQYLVLETFAEDFSQSQDSSTHGSSPTTPTNPQCATNANSDGLSDLFSLDNIEFLKDETDMQLERCSRLANFEAYGYAAAMWFVHYRSSGLFDARLERLVSQLLNVTSNEYQNWFAFHSSTSLAPLPSISFANAIVLSAIFGHAQRLKTLLKDLDPLEMTLKQIALVWAAQHSQRDSVRVLIDFGVDMTDSNTDPAPEIAATLGGSLEIFRMIIGMSGTNVNRRDQSNKTALHYAADLGHVPIIEEILKRDEADANPSDRYGQTPTIYAAMVGSLESLDRILRDERADVNHQDRQGRTALSIACEESLDNIISRLLRDGRIRADLADNSGRNALSYAATKSNVRIVQRLLKSGLSIAQKDADGRNAISWAADSHLANQVSSTGVSVISYLINADPDSADEPDCYGWTPLAWALNRPGYLNSISLLLESRKVDVNRRDKTLGRTVLSWSAAEGLDDILEYLIITAEADITITDFEGRNALSHAASNGKYEAVKFLHNQNSKQTEVRDIKGRKAIDWAILNGHDSIALFLQN